MLAYYVDNSTQAPMHAINAHVPQAEGLAAACMAATGGRIKVEQRVCIAAPPLPAAYLARIIRAAEAASVKLGLEKGKS